MSMTQPVFNRPFNPRPANALYPNRFEAFCVDCGKRVKVGGGFLYGETGNWSVRHADCVQTQQIEKEKILDDGFYTVIHSNGDYRTFRVRTQKEHDRFMPGVQILGFLFGSNNEGDYENFGHLTKNGEDVGVHLWKRFNDREDLLNDARVLVGDPNSARESYAEKSGRCSRCNRTLTVPSSLHAGLGPECSKKVS